MIPRCGLFRVHVAPLRHDSIAALTARLIARLIARRQALPLIAVDDLSYEEAAAVIGCPPVTVKSRVRRARDRLARHLRTA
jgi:DNA-directed RNA polymerase specialized sigma24 family protein